MKGKAALVVGLATGYVLGTRDGRGRYEQIKSQANRLWNDPTVQKNVAQAQDVVKEKAPQVQAKVSDAAHKAGSKVKGDDSSSTTSTSTTSSTTSTTSGTGSLDTEVVAPSPTVTPATTSVPGDVQGPGGLRG
jgi:hypothetical protein